MCPDNKKHHFGYQFRLFFLPKCKWVWEKNEAQLQQSKSCQGKIGESSVHADTLIPQGKRPHSSQRAKKLQLEIAESSVHVNDCFLVIGRTALSRANKKSAAQVLKSEMRHICLQFSLSRPGGMREAIKTIRALRELIDPIVGAVSRSCGFDFGHHKCRTC